MEILNLNILSNGYTITTAEGKVIYSQYSSAKGGAWDSNTIAITAKEAYNSFLNQAKLEVLDRLSDLRYSYQITPIAVLNGSFIPTDGNITKLSNIINSYTSGEELKHYSVAWKSSNTTWIDLDVLTAKNLLAAANTQVQNSFNVERTHSITISNITNFSDLDVYDITTGWDNVVIVTI
jgi:hypothetical protein